MVLGESPVSFLAKSLFHNEVLAPDLLGDFESKGDWLADLPPKSPGPPRKPVPAQPLSIKTTIPAPAKNRPRRVNLSPEWNRFPSCILTHFCPDLTETVDHITVTNSQPPDKSNDGLKLKGRTCARWFSCRFMDPAPNPRSDEVETHPTSPCISPDV